MIRSASLITILVCGAPTLRGQATPRVPPADLRSGALEAGVFAEFFMLEGIPGTAEAIAALRERLGPERFDAAHARGAAAEYDEIVAYMLATFDDILTETGAGEDRGA